MVFFCYLFIVKFLFKDMNRYTVFSFSFSFSFFSSFLLCLLINVSMYPNSPLFSYFINFLVDVGIYKGKSYLETSKPLRPRGKKKKNQSHKLINLYFLKIICLAIHKYSTLFSAFFFPFLKQKFFLISFI